MTTLQSSLFLSTFLMKLSSIFLIITSCYLMSCKQASVSENSRTATISTRPTLDVVATKEKALEALAFCKAQKFNEDFCILIDMKMHSGLNRFLVWDFKKDMITHRFLVGHGCCDEPWGKDMSKENPQFSNREGSHCSSLGKYKIGERAPSDWGVKIKYVLHGLDPSNSDALSRFIVFHSWEAVSDVEVYPMGTPEGWGCPTLSNDNFLIIDALLKTSKKPVLMWIYN